MAEREAPFEHVMEPGSGKAVPVLRGQILRVLVNIDLANAVGGIDSNDGRCQVVADTGAAACPTIPTR